MIGDPKVIDYLNKALRHELTAVNQYWLNADKLIERIIFLGGAPNMQTLESLHIGKNVRKCSTVI